MNDNSSSEIRKMNALGEASSLVRAVAEPCPPGDSVKAAIVRACRRLGWSYSRTRAVWYADCRIRLAADELDELRSRARARLADGEQDRYAMLIDRIARLENAVGPQPDRKPDSPAGQEAPDGATW